LADVSNEHKVHLISRCF